MTNTKQSDTTLNEALARKTLPELLKLEGLHELISSITALKIEAIPEKYRSYDTETLWSIKVEARSKNTYAVIHRMKTYMKDGTWEHESQPSSRTNKYIKNSRYTLSKAVKLAEKASREVTFFGYTAPDYTWAQEHREQYNQENTQQQVSMTREPAIRPLEDAEEMAKELAYFNHILQNEENIPEIVHKNMTELQKIYKQKLSIK